MVNHNKDIHRRLYVQPGITCHTVRILMGTRQGRDSAYAFPSNHNLRFRLTAHK